VEATLADLRVEKMARVLVDHSAQVKPGNKVVIEATTAAEALVRSVYQRVLERGGQPHLLLALPDQEEILFRSAKPEQLDFVPTFHKLAADQFDCRIRIYSETNTRAQTNLDPALQARRQKAIAAVQQSVLKRGAEGSLRWVSTLFPTEAFAIEAFMGWQEYQDFVFRACHVDDDTPDPVAYWLGARVQQERYIKRIEGHSQVTVRGPNVDLALSIRDRKFINASGEHNLPDGEIYTGPVEESVNGRVHFNYPSYFGGHIVEDIELTFVAGKVTKATAGRNKAFLLKMLDVDPGARYVGEFAIGTNYNITRATHNTLFDEKIGGSFHMALGTGYPETGSHNKSAIHWDMVCDLKESEIRVDNELIYKDGKFVE
jgi:aminopeptidase